MRQTGRLRMYNTFGTLADFNLRNRLYLYGLYLRIYIKRNIRKYATFASFLI